MSTFVRAGGGTRQTSFGTGVPSLDAAFMPGGVPSGALVCFAEETQRRSRGVALSVLRCFVAEGVAAGQAVLLVDASPAEDSLLGALSFLPTLRGDSSAQKSVQSGSGLAAQSLINPIDNMSLNGQNAPSNTRNPKTGSFRPAASACCSTSDQIGSGCCSTSANASDACCEAKGKPGQPADPALRIAWRYASLPTASARSGERSYDSGRRMDVPATCAASGATLRRHCIDFANAQWPADLTEALKHACHIGRERGTRIAIPSLGAPHWPEGQSLAVLLAVRRACRAYARTVCAMATVAPSLGRMPDVAALSDGLLAAVALEESPASGGPVQAAALRALVPVRAPGALAGHVPVCAMAAVVAHAGRVLRVEPLYIPPEDGPASSCGASVEF